MSYFSLSVNYFASNHDQYSNLNLSCNVQEVIFQVIFPVMTWSHLEYVYKKNSDQTEPVRVKFQWEIDYSSPNSLAFIAA